MKAEQKRKVNNQGFTLVELLVAMAISGIIAILIGNLIINSSKWYAGETAKSDMQNELQNINTKLRNILQEATSLTIREENGVTYVLTGELDASKNWTMDSNPNGTARAIMVYKNRLYITDKYYTPTDVINEKISKGYLDSSYLKEGSFTVQLENTVVNKETTAPLMVRVAYQMERNKKTTKTDYKVTLRNSATISTIHIGSQDITVKNQ